MHTYTIEFKGIPADRLPDVRRVVDDFSWGMGLAAEDLSFSNDGSTCSFSSPKGFDASGSGSQEDNLLLVVSGKEQMFSNVYHMLIGEGVAEPAAKSAEAILVLTSGDRYRFRLSTHSDDFSKLS